MRPFTLALALSAIPAAALGQAVSCPDCRHVASWFRGEGGFIGTVADGADEVVFVASCGSVSTTGKARVGGGTAAQLFNHGNGLACDREGGSLEIAGLKDGGWYWITDESNSAVGNLVSRDILGNDPVELTTAGAGVTMSMGTGAVFLRETATGRVGILPNILPEPRMDALRKCGYNDRGTTGTSATATADQDNARFTRRDSECALGNGGAVALATTPHSITGATRTVANKGTVVRPSGSGTVVVTIDLWGNGSGHFATAADGHALLGHAAAATTALRSAARLRNVSYSARLGSGPTAAALTSDAAAVGGITMNAGPADGTTDANSNRATLTIAADEDYCSKDNNEPAAVTVTALMADAASAAQVTPSIQRNSATNAVGGTSFTVVCGSASSSASVEAAGGARQENS